MKKDLPSTTFADISVLPRREKGGDQTQTDRNKFLRKSGAGFTAIEILIGVVVVGIVFSVAYGPLRSFRDAQVLASDTENILSLLKEARSQTVFSKNSSQYGVHFESGRAILFQGAVFGEPNANNKEFLLNSNLSISNWSLNGGGQEVVFKRLTGGTDQFGTVTAALKNNPSKVKTISISETGIAGAN